MLAQLAGQLFQLIQLRAASLQDMYRHKETHPFNNRRIIRISPCSFLVGLMAGQIDSGSMCLLLDRALPVSSLSTVMFDNQQSDQAIFITIAVNSANDISGESRFLLGRRSASCPVHSWATYGDEHGRCLMPKLKLVVLSAPP